MKPSTFTLLDSFYKKMKQLEEKLNNNLSLTEVINIENKLDTTFCQQYKDFLLRYGGGYVGAYPIYGLRKDRMMDNKLWAIDVITNHFIKQGLTFIEGNYVISDDQSGNPVFIKKNGKVYIYDHDYNELDEIAIDFEQFLLKCLNDEDWYNED